MSTIGVVVATFGSREWELRGLEKASLTRATAGADHVISIHADNLAAARNKGAREIGTDYIVFLDADDELCYNYCEVLRGYIEPGNILYQPETRGMYPDGSLDETSNFIPDRNMSESNNLVIGTAVTAQYGVEFDSVLKALEDWDFFLRMIATGAKVKRCPGMVYLVGVNENSRNAPSGAHNEAYGIIRRKGIKVSDYLLESK